MYFYRQIGVLYRLKFLKEVILSLDKFVYTGKDNLEAMREAKNYNNYLISNIIKFLPSKNKNILDFGAGSGTYAEMLKDLGYRVDCLEPDMELAKELRSKGFKVFQELEQIKTNSYDLIYSLNVFEHIKDDVDVASKLKSIANKDAIILIYVPAFQILYSSMDKLVGHYRRYDKKRLLNKIGSNNQIILIKYCDPIGYIAALIFKFIGSKEGTISKGMVRLYDKFIFPISSLIEKFTSKFFGKNLLLVIRRNS